MRDAFGRVIDYMRVSITDRCNLRCKYCMPEDLPFIHHDDILRYEEILRVCAAAARLGIKTIRVTGGEPLTRKGCVDFIRALKAQPGIENVTLTTNGVLLEPYLDELAGLKLDGLNISLDSLNQDTYLRITGQDGFKKVWRSLNRAIEVGFRVKINCVLVKGVNETEILPFARLAEELPVDVRFIELMPTGEDAGLEGVSTEEVMGVLADKYPDLSPDASKHGFGPARYYTCGLFKGGLGLIDAISSHFCSECNRLRLTSEGFLKLCLYHNDGLDLRPMLRGGAGDGEIGAAIENAVLRKPEHHSFRDGSGIDGGINKMSRIGG